MKVDYIIVGQGLAGSSVAVQLLRLNKKIIVFDEPGSNNSSRIAAGLFNPVTGKKMLKTWLADRLFPYLHDYYTTVEAEAGIPFFYPMPLYRPFISNEEQNEWMVRAAESSYSSYVQKVYASKFLDKVNNPYGGLLLKQCGFLDTQKYIQAVGILIRREGTLIEQQFEPSEVSMNDQGIAYKNYTAEKIIWCSGVHQSRWFDWLPIRALKGETISISADMPREIIINRGVYMVPEVKGSSWKVGSTYNFEDTSHQTTTAGRQELELKTRELITATFEVIDHQYGFRPTTPDRRPILGAHPEFQQLVVFNGLGTKGVSLAPYFSEVLVHSLEKKGSINKEVNIERYKSVYSSSPK